MKRIVWILMICIVLVGCAGRSERPSVIIYDEETEGVETTVAKTTESVGSEDEETEETVEKTQKESTEKESEEDIKEESTEAPTEPPTTAPYPVEISAVVNGTHYLGDRLTSSDFSVAIRYSDGNVINNPDGWSAAPLDVALGDNYVEVQKDGLSTVITYYAGERPTEPPTEPPATQAPVVTPPVQPVPPTSDRVTIILDPGHGGYDPGAIGYGLQEKDLALKVALYCRAYLLENYDGIDIIMTRNQDNSVELYSRSDFLEIHNANFLVSFHFNATAEHNANGAEVLISEVPGINGYASALGNYVLNELLALGLVNRGLVTRELYPGIDYYAINRKCADHGKVGVIIEHCFIDSPADQVFINSEEALRAMGEADARGIAAYLGRAHK